MDIQEPKNDLTFEKVFLMFEKIAQELNDITKQSKETDKKFRETEKLLSQKFQETDKQFKETNRRWKEIQEELGGMGKSNGLMAEDFFYSVLEKTMQVANLRFDYIDRNMRRKRKNTEAEYDIVLYNKYKVLIVEVKYNFKMQKLHDFYANSLKKFRKLYPEYSEYKIYGAIAAFTFEKDVIKEAQNYGFYILTQANDKMKIVNPKDFAPNEIK